MQTDQSKYYDVSHHLPGDAWDARMECLAAFLHRALPGMQMSPKAQVLDVGCANGLMLRTLPPEWRRVGVDVTEPLLRLAREGGIETHLCDFDNHPLPFGDGEFELVFCNDVIEHVLHTDHVLNEINRVLKPGGWLFMSIPNINQPVSLVMQFILDLTPMFAARYRCTHYRDFTHRLFQRITTIHGFSITRAAGTFIYPWGRSRLSRAVARWIPRWGMQILYLAQKARTVQVPEGFTANMPELMAWFKRPLEQCRRT